MTPPLPLEEIPQLMQFIAEKAKNVKYPMNITELCRQFQKETGSSISVFGLRTRIEIHRQRIHEMNEFDLGTKVKMIFALSAPIDAGFLSELKKVADVEVDYQQQIIHYKHKDGGMESSSKMLFLMDQREDRNKNIIQFLADKADTSNIPMIDNVFLKEFKAKTDCPDSVKALSDRFARLKNTLFQLTEFDKNTKIKMMFISHAKLTYENLKELRKDAYVEVDEVGRITIYKANDGSLELEGYHSLFARIQTARVEDERQRIAAILKRKRAREVSEGDAEESMKIEDDSSMYSDTSKAEYFLYNQANYEKDMNHIPLETKPESLLEVKLEEPGFQSTSIGGDHYFFDYDAKEDTNHIPVEKKPDYLLEVKIEEPDGPSTSNFKYHCEDNVDLIIVEPKPEIN